MRQLKLCPINESPKVTDTFLEKLVILQPFHSQPSSVILEKHKLFPALMKNTTQTANLRVLCLKDRSMIASFAYQKRKRSVIAGGIFS